VVDHQELHNATLGHEMFFEIATGGSCCSSADGQSAHGDDRYSVDDPETAICTDQEVDYILNMVRKVFPDIQVDRSHYRLPILRRPTFEATPPPPGRSAAITALS
jgi:glycerol-3-phosphate dehydrogenase